MKYHDRLLASLALVVSAQSAVLAQARAADRTGVALTAGFAAIPDPLSTQCGNAINGGGAAGFDLSAAVLVRPRRWLVLQADTRAMTQSTFLTGCALVLPAVDTEYAAGTYHQPLVSSTLRVGAETPPDLPMLRATLGAGVVWGRRPLPVQVVAIGAGTRGRRVRFLIEAERASTRVHAEEVHANFGTSPVQRLPIVVHPVWHSVRLGVELPLGHAQ